MAVTQNTYTGNGSTVLFSFTFPYLETTDIKVSLNGTVTTAYTLANATTVQMNAAPAVGAAIRIYRDTDIDDTSATFFPGSSIRSEDLNQNFDQILYATQETRTLSESTATTANGIAGTANTALSNSSAAVATANTASTNATAATSTANTALSTANTALSTANTASSNASTALSTANTASSTATTASGNATAAVTTANAADSKADTAIAAVSAVVPYVSVANVAAISASPANDTYIEVADSTGLQSFTPLAGMPAGFIGDAGLSVRLRYTSAGTTWNWLGYVPNNSDTRYLKKAVGAIVDADVNASAGIVATKLAFTQAGTGAVQRTVDSKLCDVVSVKDFGAVGDGVSNDRVAIQSAITAAAGKVLYFPAGTYLISLASGTHLASPAANTTLVGEGKGSLLDIRTTSTTYLNVFGISADNIAFRELKIGLTLQAAQLASLFIFTGATSGFSLRGCELFSSNSAVNANHYSYMLNLPSASNAGVSEVWVEDCTIHNWHYTLLKINTSQSVDRCWKVANNYFHDNQTSHWSPNSPSGTHDDVLISGNTFGSLYGTDVGLNHLIGLASVSNCRIVGNTFKGLAAGEAIHIEEDSDNITISGNTIEIGELTNQVIWGDGIRFMENNVGGVMNNPTRVTVANNIIKRTGAQGGTGVAFTYNVSADAAIDMPVCIGNVIEGFDMGVEVDLNSLTACVTNNTFKSCGKALSLPKAPGSSVENNTIIDCTTGILASGLVGASHFFGTTTMPFDGAPTGALATTEWSRTQRGITLTASGNTNVSLLPIGLRFNGTLRFVVTGGVGTTVLSGSATLAYNGTTMTDTLLEFYAPGIIAYSDILSSSGNLALQIYNSGAELTDCFVWVNFSGLHVFS